MLALAAKKIPYEPRRLVNSKREQKSETYLSLNPRGTVPTLVDGDIIVRETNAILAYLEAAYPGTPLLGTNPAQVAEIWQIVCETDARLRTPIGNVSRPIFRGRAMEMMDEIKQAIGPVHQELEALESSLDGRPYLCGETLTAADCAVFPAIMQLLRCANKDGAEVLELGVAPLENYYPNLSAWAHRIENMPGYAEAYPPHWR